MWYMGTWISLYVTVYALSYPRFQWHRPWWTALRRTGARPHSSLSVSAAHLRSLAAATRRAVRNATGRKRLSIWSVSASSRHAITTHALRVAQT